ncbi:SAM-dependent methyltransferase [Polymorphobacter fuscus]|uniref:Methyltransferase domain-containing protein n=1 Tax=Sandarakinorhabdus fusca TaxID=1439888 RepID=A0A7C9GQY6_9SPHN|nr:SAM-dependent methyltransferase [Polymorphobacter fuscus]KAB7645582.1 methyltransferase domain-containing protein [Polymorphobacter fuscus]MQT18030.1 methyltransferase domain-containing protein [Polymorphobacter fuscus]NJC08663.1 putative TPR repeat methyltransferase [Polymorphobacter fuscus]
MAATSLDAGYFDRLYAADADPWRFETSAYEDAKYAATLRALPRARYRSAIEVGCSIGVLTERLAARCDAVLGIDVAEAALVQARQRCAALTHVRFVQAYMPAEHPAGPFDLILLSEVLYYFDRPTVAAMADAVLAMAGSGADIMLVHWLGPTPDYPLNGDEAVTAFLNALGERAVITFQRREAEYRLDRLRIA